MFLKLICFSNNKGNDGKIYPGKFKLSDRLITIYFIISALHLLAIDISILI